MEKFSQWLSERADDPKTPEPGDLQAKGQAVRHIWMQLQELLNAYYKIIAPLSQISNEVATEIKVKVEEAINNDRNLSNEDFNDIMNILQSHNRFNKFTYLKDWPKKQPDWWTGPEWEK